MAITVLREILVARGEVQRLFEGTVPINLWRALNRTRPGGVFDFVTEAFVLSNGRPRPADITTELRRGVPWVLITERPRGVSTFDKPGVPRGRDWDYFRIPAGTVLPEGIVIVKDEFNSSFGATHYTIAPAHDMPLQQFRFLLEQLAKTVVKEAV